MKRPENENLNNIIEYVKEEAEKLDYGKITLDVRENGKVIDVSTERRKRFVNKNN